jgi:hypothetical protein
VYQALVELPRAKSERAPIGRVWNVPARNTQFTGRDRLLADLRRSLSAGDATVAHAFLLSGITARCAAYSCISTLSSHF